jgi:hypothetical protein
MGKRELLIALAFVVAGVVAFRFAGPAPEGEKKGFSFSDVVDRARREMQGSRSYAAPPRVETYPAPASVTEVRVEGANGTAKVVGSDRADVSLTLNITSTGADEATAIAIAGKVTVTADTVGGALTLRLTFPPEERQTAGYVLAVPSRLAVRLDAPRDPVVSDVASLEFLNPSRGTAELTRIGAVMGDQTGGTLTMTDVREARLLLSRVRATITGLTGTTSLDVRDGETEITGSRGRLEIEERRGNLKLLDFAGPITVSGTDGELRIEGARHDVRVDLRRAGVDVEFAAPAAASLVTSDETLRVALPDPGGVQLDAQATNATIDASAWSLEAVTKGEDARLDAVLGTKSSSAPRVSVRNVGGDILLRKSSKK